MPRWIATERAYLLSKGAESMRNSLLRDMEEVIERCENVSRKRGLLKMSTCLEEAALTCEEVDFAFDTVERDANIACTTPIKRGKK